MGFYSIFGIVRVLLVYFKMYWKGKDYGIGKKRYLASEGNQDYRQSRKANKGRTLNKRKIENSQQDQENRHNFASRFLSTSYQKLNQITQIDGFIKKTLKTCAVKKEREDQILYDFQIVQFFEQIKDGNDSRVYLVKLADQIPFFIVKKVRSVQENLQREERLAKKLRNPFIVKVIATYHSKDKQNMDFFNILMEKYDNNLLEVIENGAEVSEIALKVYIYQLLRALMYLHSEGICHRNIRPENILLKKHKIVLCGFSSAKFLKKSEQNSLKVNGLQYRSPQILTDCPYYGFPSDIWAAGCVTSELITHRQLFSGFSRLDQLVRISQILGTSDWLRNQGLKSQNFHKIPKMKARGLKSVLPVNSSHSLVDLLEGILTWNPKDRLNAAQALAHPFFDLLRDETIYREIQEKTLGVEGFFEFNRRQFRSNQQLMNKLIPHWARNSSQKETRIDGFGT